MAHAVYWPTMPTTGNRNRRAGLEEAIAREEYWACIIVPLTFWLFASLTLTLGLYGTQNLVLGPHYSHLFKANSLLVDQIEVTDNGKPGPVLHGFKSRPTLDSSLTWNDKKRLAIDPDSHQEFEVWLNEGSRMNVTCSIKSSSYFSILVAILEGHTGLQEWIHDPTNGFSALAWQDVSGQGGRLEYEVTNDGSYYVAVGNLNPQTIEIVLELEIDAKMYNVNSATYRCSLDEGITCRLELTAFGHRFALLTTPNATQNGSNVWKLHLSYGVRWVTYFLALVCMFLIVWAALNVFNSVRTDLGGAAAEVDARAPLLTSKENSSSVGTPSYGSIGSDANGATGEDGKPDGLSSDSYDGEVCAVCLDSPRSCFFIPCGHCATCIPCATRILKEELGTCPICRHEIEEVKKMFHA